MSVLRKLASQTALYGLSSILGRLINWLLTPIFVNVFLPAQYGVLSDLYALTFYPLIILTFGMETTFFRWAEERSGAAPAYATACSNVLLFALGFAVLIGLGHEWLARLLGYPDAPRYVLLVGGIIFLDVLAALPLARLRHQERAGYFAFVSLTNIGLMVVLNLVFIFGLGLREDITYVLVANLIASGAKLGLSLKGTLPRRLPLRSPLRGPMLHYGLFIMIAGLGGAINESIDRNLLPRLWPAEGALWHGEMRSGLEMTGIYAAVYKLAMFVTLGTQAFRYAAEPFFFRNAGQQESPRLFARIFHWFMLVALLMFLLVTAFRLEICAFNLFGLLDRSLIPPTYWVGLEVVPVLLLANVFLGAYVNLSIWFKITKQVRFALLFTGVGVLITLLVNLSLIPLWGYWASALATLLAYLAMSLLVYLFGQRHYPIPYRIRRLGLYLALALLTWLALDAGLGAGEVLSWGRALAKLGLVSSWVLLVLAMERRWPSFS